MTRHALYIVLSACLWGGALSASAQTAPAQAPAATPVPAAPDAAAEEQDPPEAPEPPKGFHTRAWIKAQGEREQASRRAQPMSGPVMQRVHERYLKSFEVPVPTRIRDGEPLTR